MKNKIRVIFWVVLIGAILCFFAHWAIAVLTVTVIGVGYLLLQNTLGETNKGKSAKDKNPQPKYKASTQGSIKQQLDEVVDGNQGVLELEKLLAILEVERGQEKTFPKRSLDQVITTLTGFGYGMIPNYQLDHKRITYGEVCVLYKFPLSLYNLKSSRMRQKEMFFKLLAMVFGTDGLSSEDLGYAKRCNSELGLANEFQGHFCAYTIWLSQKKQPLDKKTKDDLALLPEALKQSYTKLLLNAVYANGEIDNKRVATLQKLLPFLGFDANSVHSLLHQTLTDESGFAPAENGSHVPKTHSLDIGKLNELKEQTRAAQDLLAEIFVEEAEAPKPNLEQKENSLVEVLAKLLEKEVWTRDEIKELVGPGVMIGNLLEEINDYSYSKVDDIVVEEDGDQIYITTEYKNQLI